MCGDPITAPKVKRIFELFAFQPLTLDTLKDALARQGVVYSDRHPRFDRSVLHRVLKNRIYLGEVWSQGSWYPGKFEPLVDLATFQAVQDRFGGRVHHKPQITFAGQLITCGHCGHAVTGEKKLKRGKRGTIREYSYYWCTQNRKAGHPRVRMTEDAINTQVLALFQSIRIEDAEIRSWFVEVIRAQAKAGQRENQVHRVELERQRLQVDSRLKALLELRMSGEIDSGEFAPKRAELQERQAGLRLQLESSDLDDRQIMDQAIKAFELSQSLKNRWETADYSSKREILGILCESIRSNHGKLEFSLRKPFDLLSNEKLVAVNGAGGIRTPVSGQSA